MDKAFSRFLNFLTLVIIYITIRPDIRSGFIYIEIIQRHVISDIAFIATIISFILSFFIHRYYE